MPVVITMLRAVNVGGHNKVPMDGLRELCASLKLRDAQTYVQSGNVVFKTDERNPDALSGRIQKGIEKRFGCCPEVILRTTAELRDVVKRNPFAKRRDIEPNKFLVVFLASEPSAQARAEALELKAGREEFKIVGREVYMYFPDGLARPRISWMTVERKLGVPGTGRNWNSVNKLLEIAERLEAGE
jgi:uncharacterized protein (DUF1697 family)